jgi:hypothetical protein
MADIYYYIKFLLKKNTYREYYKASSKKISVVMLNWKRCINLYRIIESLRKSELVDDIIIWNNNPKEMLLPLSFVAGVKIIHSPVNTLLGRFLASLLAEHEAVYMQDDDILLNNEGLNKLYCEWQNEHDIIHGLYGRKSEGDEYALCDDNDVDILTTRCIIFDKKHAHSFFKNLYSLSKEIQEIIRRNGEDIVFSYTVMKNSGKRNKQHIYLKKYRENLNEIYSLSDSKSHYYEKENIAHNCKNKLLENK